MLPQIPILKDPKKIFKIITTAVEIGKRVMNWISGDDVKEEKPMDVKRGTVDETSNLNRLLLDYRQNVKEETKDFENQIKLILNEIFNEICDCFEFANSRYKIYKVELINRKLEYILEDIDGIFERHVAKEISLDNDNCIDVLKMMPGELKGKRMAELKYKVMRNTIDDICEKIENFEDDLFYSIDTSIEYRMNSIEKNLEEKSKSFELILEENEEREKNLEEILIKSNYTLGLIDICNKEVM